MHNQLSIVFDDVLNAYIKECVKYESEKHN